MKSLRLTLTSVLTIITLSVLFVNDQATRPVIEDFSMQFDQGNEEVFKDIEIIGINEEHTSVESFSYVNQNLLQNQDYHVLARMDSIMHNHSRKEDEMIAKYPELFRQDIFRTNFFENEDYYFSITVPDFYMEKYYDKAHAPLSVKMLDKQTGEITDFTVPRQTDRTSFSLFYIVGAYYKAPHLYILTNNMDYSVQQSSPNRINQDSLIISHYNTDTNQLVETVESDIYDDTDLSNYPVKKDLYRTATHMIVHANPNDVAGFDGTLYVDLEAGTFTPIALPERFQTEDVSIEMKQNIYQSGEEIYFVDETSSEEISLYPLVNGTHFSNEPIKVPIVNTLKNNHEYISELGYDPVMAHPAVGFFYDLSIVDGKVFIQSGEFNDEGLLPFQVFDLNDQKTIASGHYRLTTDLTDKSKTGSYQLKPLVNYYTD